MAEFDIKNVCNCCNACSSTLLHGNTFRAKHQRRNSICVRTGSISIHIYKSGNEKLFSFSLFQKYISFYPFAQSYSTVVTHTKVSRDQKAPHHLHTGERRTQFQSREKKWWRTDLFFSFFLFFPLIPLLTEIRDQTGMKKAEERIEGKKYCT